MLPLQLHQQHHRKLHEKNKYTALHSGTNVLKKTLGSVSHITAHIDLILANWNNNNNNNNNKKSKVKLSP
jgi:hypothetical protein